MSILTRGYGQTDRPTDQPTDQPTNQPTDNTTYTDTSRRLKMTPKLSQNQMSELKETKKMKVVQLHE